MAQRIQVKDNDFQSPYTDREVAQEFRRRIENGEFTRSTFAQSIYQKARQYGKYTTGQIPWLHVLVAQAEGRATKPVAAALSGLESIHAHLTDCRARKEDGGKGLLHPLVVLHVSDVPDGVVALKLAGKQSKNQGKVSVASDHRYGHGQFYGWIDADGNLDSRKGVPPTVAALLTRVAQDPVMVISQIGRESGRCCYCFAELSQVGSKIAGCGKTCADKWNAEYPLTAAIREHVIRHPEILEGSSDRDKWEPAPA
jgi:hypothetical protein